MGWAGPAGLGSIVAVRLGVLMCATKSTFPFQTTLVTATCHRTAGELQLKPEQLEVIEVFVRGRDVCNVLWSYAHSLEYYVLIKFR